MSRFLFASTPVAAHSASPLPIVRRLVAAGHEVVWHAGQAFADAITATGARHVPIIDAVDFSGRDPFDFYPHLRGLRGMRLIQSAFRDIFLEQIAGTVSDLERILSTFPADVVVADALGYAAGIVHERGGPVHATLSDGPVGLSGPDVAPFGPGVLPGSGGLARARNRAMHAVGRSAFRALDDRYGEIRRDHGLGGRHPWVFDAMVTPYLYLQGSVPELEYPRRNLPDHLHWVGALRPEPPTAWERPGWWSELDDGRRLVHVSQGTLRPDPDELMIPAVEALGGTDVSVVVTTGECDPARLGPLPSNVRAVPFVPYAELMQRTSLFVTNGGWIGLTLALHHGVPIVQVGNTEEKAENGARIAWAGVGRRMKTTSPSPRALRTAVFDVLDDPAFRERTDRMRSSFQAHDATAEAAILLERLAVTQAPVRRQDFDAQRALAAPAT